MGLPVQADDCQATEQQPLSLAFKVSDNDVFRDKTAENMKEGMKMSIFNKIGHLLESKKIKQPIFVKEFTTQNSQLDELTKLVETLKPGTKKEMVERDITFIKHGIEGEKNVAFELKNAFLPILKQ